MREWEVKILDGAGTTLASFVSVGSYGRAYRAGCERAENTQGARNVRVERV